MRSPSRLLGQVTGLASVLTLTVSCGGGDATGPDPLRAASITISPTVVALSWIGESSQLTAQVRDQNGAAMTGQAVSWSSSNSSVATVSPGGLVVAAGQGAATVIASSGTASGSVSVTVTQTVVSLVKIFGDAQRGDAGGALPDSLVLEVRDQGGTPIAGASVSWVVTSGGGMITSSQDQADEAGRAFARWALGGAAGAQSVRASTGALAIVFTAEAVAVPPLQASLEPNSVTVTVGQTTDLAVIVTGGVQGAAASWTCASSNTGMASVAATAPGCRVLGVTAGSAAITATVTKGGASTTATVGVQVVQPSGAVTITSTQPAVLIEGQSAKILGTGFLSPTQVSIGGLSAVVSEMSTTSITITVPRSDCLPPRQAPLVVSAPAGTASMSVGVTPRTQEDLELPLRSYRYTFAGNGCLHLPGNAAGGEYLIGVVSTSQTPSAVTPVSLAGIPGDATVVGASPVMAVAGPPDAMAAFEPIGTPEPRQLPQLGAEQSQELLRLQELTERHRDAEAETMANNMALHAALGPSLALSSPQRAPAKVVQGDVVTLWADGERTCSLGQQVNAVVRLVGNNAVWLDDLANPAGTFTDAELSSLDAFYAANVRAIHDSYFGGLSDIDFNGRVQILLTKEVNKIEGVNGWVWWGDLYATPECATSNQAEMFFGFVPDPNGVFGAARTKQSVLERYPSLLTHEITHLVQGNAAVFGGAGQKKTWETEGGASLAEQLVAYGLFGHGSGQDLGFAQFDQSDTSRYWYWNAWLAAMFQFFGWDSSGDGSGRVLQAPEQCTWIGRVTEGNTGPCRGSHVYGVPSMVLRFAMDRWGAGYPGGEAALMKRLTTSPSFGFSSLEEVSGWRIEQILAEFYMALWGDGRTGNWYGMSSWDLYDVFSAFQNHLQLQPYTSTVSGPQLSVNVRGGSSAYLHWEPAGSLAPTSIKVTTPGGAPVPGNVAVWALRVR